MTNPLQLINDPTVPDSRQLIPIIRAVIVHAVNLPAKSKHISETVNPQVIPAARIRK
jgi:hypothetical protein